MQYRAVDGVQLSEIGLGCDALGGVYGPVDVAEIEGVIRRAYDLGVNFFDATDVHSQAEVVLGKAVKPFRDQILIATKVGRKDGFEPELSSDYLTEACEASLRRLGTEWIDLYQVDYADPKTTFEQVVETLEELKQAGKIRRYGISHLPEERLEEFFRHGDVFSLLAPFSLIKSEIGLAVMSLCRQHQAAFLACSVTGRGMLTGKLPPYPSFEPGDTRMLDPLFQRQQYRSGIRLAEKLARVGAQYGKSAAQMAISWVLSHEAVTCALTGPSSVAHLEENLAASGWQLPQEALATLEIHCRAEEDALLQEQRQALEQILANPLQDDNLEAYQDLLLTMEVALCLDLVTEEAIYPLYLDFHRLRNEIENARPDLEEIHAQLQEMIGL
jgi:aryl-alcohol dehydrogenase-like predicted oxidoreductase